MKKFLVCIFILISSFNTVYAQDFNRELDSLRLQLLSSQTPINKLEIFNRIGEIYNRSNVDSALVYFEKGKQIAETLDEPKFRFKSYNNLGASFIVKGIFDSSVYYFNKSQKLLTKIKDYTQKTAYYGDRGILEYYQGNIPAAAKNFEKSLKIATDAKDTTQIIRYSNNVALAYSQLGSNKEAVDIYFDVLKIAEEVDDLDHIGKILNNIGLVYESMNQYENALNYYKKGLNVKKEKGTQIDLANSYYNIGNMQLKLIEVLNDSTLFESAKNNLNKAIEISEQNEYGTGKLYGLEGLGQLYLFQKNINKAQSIFKKMDSLSDVYKNQPTKGVSNLRLAYIASLQNKFTTARKHLNIARSIVENSKVQSDRSQLYEALSLLSANEGNYETAYQYLLTHKAIDDSLSSKNLQDRLSNYDVKYESEKKERQILEQRTNIAEKELALTKKNTQLLSIGIVAVVLGLLGYLLYTQQRLKNTQLLKEAELKEALAQIETQNKLQDQRLQISRDLHDNIGAQLTFIISSVDNLKYGFKLPENLSERLKNISAFTTTTIFELRDTIWAMNKSEISLEELRGRISNFIEKANDVVDRLQFKFEVDQTIEDHLTFSSVNGMNVYRIIQEAIHNALKYADANSIRVNLKKADDQLVILIADDGIGFNMDAVEFGNGLENMRMRADDLGGKISIDSEVGHGTQILVEMPFKALNLENNQTIH